MLNADNPTVYNYAYISAFNRYYFVNKIEAYRTGLFILTMDYGGMKELAEIVGNYFFINPINKEKLKKVLYNITETQFLNPNISPFSEDTFKKSLLFYITFIKN